MRLAFTVPGPPVPKARARVVAGKGAFTPKRTKDYEKHVKTCAFAAVYVMRGWRKDAPRYSVEMRLYGGTGDLSNMWKACEDAMNKVVYLDDDRVKKMFAEELDDGSPPRAEIVVEYDD